MKRYFGTDGIRGKANADLTIDIAKKLARALSLRYTKVFIGRDTRVSSPMFAAALISTALSCGMEVMDIGLVGTPCLCYALRKEEDASACGVMVTASHNPYYDNGLKVLSSVGEKLTKEEERYLEGAMDVPHQDVYPEEVGEYHLRKEIKSQYVKFLVNHCPHASFTGKLYFDDANGSAGSSLRQVATFLSLPFQEKVQRPNGMNINDHCGVLHIHEVFQRLKEHETDSFDLLVSLDGDGDRCEMMLKDGTLLDGDALCYLIATALKEREKLPLNKVVVTSMSSDGLIASLKEKGITAVITDVGDRALAEAMKKEKISLASEQSGHMIIGDAIGSGDGILTMLTFFSYYHSLEDIKRALDGYHPSFQELINIPFENRDALRIFVNSPQYEHLLSDFSQKDGVRVVIRPSGTEPFLRVLFDAKSRELLENSKADLAKLFVVE